MVTEHVLLQTFPDDDEMSVLRKYDNNDLADFQSSIALEKSLGEQADSKEEVSGEAEVVDTFLQQYSWVRRLADASSALFESGHLDYYPRYIVEMPVATPMENFRLRVELLEKERDSWGAHVRSVRRQFYFINYLDLKRCFLLFELLRLDASRRTSTISSEQGEAFGELCAKLAGFMSTINSDYAHEPTNARHTTRNLIAHWNRLATVAESDSADLSNQALLVVLGETLDATFSEIPARVRPATVANLDAYVSKDPLPRGVHVAFPPQSLPGLAPKAQYDQLLTIAAIQGVLPEAETCLCCSAETNIEHVSMLIYRWHRAHLYDRKGTTYSLVEAEKLSYDVQHLASLLLRELGSPSSVESGPLVIIAENECHLAGQFSFNKVTNGVLPMLQLAELCEQLVTACHTSKNPGGKEEGGGTVVLICILRKKSREHLCDYEALNLFQIFVNRRQVVFHSPEVQICFSPGSRRS